MNCKLWIVNCKQITVHYSARIMNSELWTLIQLPSAVLITNIVSTITVFEHKTFWIILTYFNDSLQAALVWIFTDQVNFAPLRNFLWPIGHCIAQRYSQQNACFVIMSQCTQSKFMSGACSFSWNPGLWSLIEREKGNDLTQSYDKSPYTTRKWNSRDNTKTPPKLR